MVATYLPRQISPRVRLRMVSRGTTQQPEDTRRRPFSSPQEPTNVTRQCYCSSASCQFCVATARVSTSSRCTLASWALAGWRGLGWVRGYLPSTVGSYLAKWAVVAAIGTRTKDGSSSGPDGRKGMDKEERGKYQITTQPGTSFVSWLARLLFCLTA